MARGMLDLAVMRALPTAALVATLALPAFASAGPLSAGVELGTTQAETQAADGYDPSGTAGLWLRYQPRPRLAIEASFGKIASENNANQIRTVGFSARFTPVTWRKGTLRPVVLAGLAIDHSENDNVWQRGELGIGLEFDLTREFLIGADLRAGDRAWESGPVDDAVPIPAARIAYDLTEGNYRSSRLYLGMRF